MRSAALLLVCLLLFAGGCREAVREIETPGPAPPPNPKEAAIDPKLIEHKPADNERPATGQANDPPADAERDRAR